MKFEIQKCSPKAERRIKSWLDVIGVTKQKISEGSYLDDWRKTYYPFEELRIGECFILQFEGTSRNSVQVLARYHSKKLKKRFTIVKHDEHQCYEIARIA